MKKIILGCFVLMFCLCSVHSSFAQSPETIKEQAFSEVRTASALMERAASAMNNYKSESDLKLALGLFAEAGKLFQNAAGKFQALVPEYASETDLNGCIKAMEACMNAINRIKERLTEV
jgi:hypothetical protein